MNDILSQPRVESEADPAPPRGPKVLQVLPALGEGGVERGTIDIARYLVEHGWDAIVASEGGAGEDALDDLGATSLRLPLSSKNPLVIRANIRHLERAIRAHGIQIVHARSRAPAWSAYFAARRTGVPFVTTFHGVYEGSERWWKKRYNAIMARGERVIAISNFVADHVRTQYGVDKDRLRVVHRGVDLRTFDPAAVSEERIQTLRDKWQVPAGPKILLLPGRITRIKGHDLLLRALERVVKPSFFCLFVGGYDPRSSYVSEIEGLSGALGLRDSVRLVGGTDDMPAALALADLVVVPSIGPEAFGRVSAEAQAMGKPVIVSDIGGLSETVMPAATGWLVKPGDIAQLGQAVELGLAMPDDARARLAVRARRFITRSFALEQMGRQTMAVYRELLERRHDADDDTTTLNPTPA